MARSSNDYNSASSQIFICHKDATSLDGAYASFGKVFAGMDAVDTIANTETGANDKPVTDQKIKTIRFIKVEEA
jgi:peptidyl-prolyl cis-trans isomerase B (cyclophilin B)